MRRYLGLAGFLVLTLGVGFAGRLATSSSVDTWYPTLAKPPLTPPDWIFGPVWTTLYILMAIAAWRIWLTLPGPGRRISLAVFVLQLVLNLAWSPVFFGLHQIEMALWIIIALDVLVILTVILFWRVRRLAAVLLLPYLAWILFATALNWQFLQLNPNAAEVTGAVERLEL